MPGRGDEQLAHILWWTFHAAGFAAVCYLPTDFRLADGVTAHHWVVAVALSLNVLAHYHVRYSNPGWAPSAAPQNGHSARCAAAGYYAGGGTGQCFKDCEAAPSQAPGGAHVCSQCGALWRHPATVHCRFCDRCIEGFDHHCIWLGVCVGGRNHHLFARYTVTQAAVCTLGFHYALTACGRSGRGGQSWAYALLFVMGLMTVVLSCLAATHVFLVLTGQTTRQVVQRVRTGGGGGGAAAAAASGGGMGGAVAARLGGALRRALPSPAAAAAAQQPVLSAGQVAQNCAVLVCGVRPGWLAGGSPWLAAANEWVAAAVSNRYYSCC